MVFPKKIREKAYIYHLVYPEYTQLVAFPIIGFILSYVFPWAIAYRLLFLSISIGSFLMLPFIKSKIRSTNETTFKATGKKGRVKLPRPFFAIFLSQTSLYVAQAIIPNIVLVYYVMIVLKQTFFVVMVLEVLNSTVTIGLGTITKKLEIKARAWLIGGVSLFIMEQIMYVSAGMALSIFPMALGILFGTAGNVLWFPVNRSMLMKYIPEDFRGQVFGSISSVSQGINLFIPLVSAYLITVFIYSPFIVSASLFAVSLFGYAIITGRTKAMPTLLFSEE